jgi:heme exporter protein A
MADLIQVNGLSKYFGRFSALRGLDLTVPSGQFIALFGRNGAGKTTLLRILAGLSRPSSGRLTIGGAGPGSQGARAISGYLAHNTSLYFDLTALENLRFYAQLLGLPLGDAGLRERIERVGLAGREHEPVRNYSRGMQQRLAIARAFLHDPSLLLLDEPFTGLDHAGSEFLRRYLSDARSGGRTCLMALHDAALGHALADRLVVIEKGAVALDVARESAGLDEFLARYQALTEGR